MTFLRAQGSAAECCAACVSEPRCLAYVYDKGGQYPKACFLKADLTGQKTKPGSVGAICRGNPGPPSPSPPQKPPKSKGWDCSGCYGAMYASGTAEGLTPPLDGKCTLSPPPPPSAPVPLKSDDAAAAW